MGSNKENEGLGDNFISQSALATSVGTLIYDPQTVKNGSPLTRSWDGQPRPRNSFVRMEDLEPVHQIPLNGPSNSLRLSPPKRKGKRAQKNTLPAATNPLLPNFGAYLKLQDEVTMLRVQLQQSRSAASRARKELANRESLIAQALWQTKDMRTQIDPGYYRQLLATADQARNVLGPLEQEVEDLEFRLVPEEDRLVKEVQILQQLISGYTHGESTSKETDSYLPAPPSPRSQELNDSRRASTVFYFEEDSDSIHRPYFDPDDSDEQNLVDQYAPDLSSEKSWLRSEDPAMPDHLELYVHDHPDIEGSSTNEEEYMELTSTDQLPTVLHLPHRRLGKFFSNYDKHFKRWMLHFHHLRQSVQDMIDSNTLDANAIRKAFIWYNNIHRGLVGRASLEALPSSNKRRNWVISKINRSDEDSRDGCYGRHSLAKTA